MMNKKGKETAEKTANPGAVFREARLKTGKSQDVVADETAFSVSLLSDLENGRFTTSKGKLKRDLPLLVRSLAKDVYRRPELEDYFCTTVCPIGQQREQLRYEDIDAIRDRLLASLTQLERSTKTIVEMLEDKEISPDEWDKCEEMLKLLRTISRETQSAELWAKIRGIHPPTKKGKTTAKKGKAVPADDGNVYKAVRRNQKLDQDWVSWQTNIDHNRISGIEQEGTKRKLPNVNEALALSRAYLSPRIRNFYCYHDCPIGGTLEPLNIHSLPDIALMLVSSLHYVRDMNLQLGFAVTSAEEKAASSNAVPEVLPELKKLSNRADTLSLWMQEELCRRLREILADNRVTPDEREEFVRILGFLKQLGVTEDFLAEMREYLKE